MLGRSQPDWNYVAPFSPPQGAPNILLILTDDAGFGNPRTFGGQIRPYGRSRCTRAAPGRDNMHAAPRGRRA
jgi:arylsulfatase A-like enzyme